MIKGAKTTQRFMKAFVHDATTRWNWSWQDILDSHEVYEDLTLSNQFSSDSIQPHEMPKSTTHAAIFQL